jgi:hypothetical protein
LAAARVGEQTEAVVVIEAAFFGIEDRQQWTPAVAIAAIDGKELIERREFQIDAALAQHGVTAQEKSGVKLAGTVVDPNVSQEVLIERLPMDRRR